MFLEFVGKYQRCGLYSLAGTAITEYHSLCGLIYRNLFSPVLEAVRPRSKCQQGLVFAVASLLGLQRAALLLCSHGACSLCIHTPVLSVS